MEDDFDFYIDKKNKILVFKGEKFIMAPMNMKFVDAQDLKSRYPETFEAPDEFDLNNLMVGDWVKVCVGGERFWIKIKDIVGLGHYSKIFGVVDNDLLCSDTHGLSYGDRVVVEGRHVYDIQRTQE
ncbi:MAG: hypothetical protein QW303_03350 [Nitrososphaerota archaeon]